MMVTDNQNFFTNNEELLQDVSQFVLQLFNTQLSMTSNFATGNVFEDDDLQILEEINEYKCYDV